MAKENGRLPESLKDDELDGFVIINRNEFANESVKNCVHSVSSIQSARISEQPLEFHDNHFADSLPDNSIISSTVEPISVPRLEPVVRFVNKPRSSDTISPALQLASIIDTTNKSGSLEDMISILLTEHSHANALKSLHKPNNQRSPTRTSIYHHNFYIPHPGEEELMPFNPNGLASVSSEGGDVFHEIDLNRSFNFGSPNSDTENSLLTEGIANMELVEANETNRKPLDNIQLNERNSPIENVKVKRINSDTENIVAHDIEIPDETDPNLKWRPGGKALLAEEIDNLWK